MAAIIIPDDPGDVTIRLLGISLSNLKHQAEQLPLFEDERKKLFATQAMDSINDHFGRMSVTYGIMLPGKETAG
jgi:DNA polymerase-4